METWNTSRTQWSDLGIDVLYLILDRLGTIENLRFGLVCRSWMRARASHGIRRPVPQLPWLIARNRGWEISRQLINSSDGKQYMIKLPELFGEYVFGSSGSWLIMQGGDRFLTLYLYNPFTLAKIDLPSRPSRQRENSDLYSLPVFAVASEPHNPDFAMVLFDPVESFSFAYTLQNDQKWHVRHVSVNGMIARLQSLVSVGKKVYGLTTLTNLVAIEFADRQPVVTVFYEAGMIECHPVHEHISLVESDGELLAVIKACPYHRATPAFRIFRFDVAVVKWLPTDMWTSCLGDRLLFLGPSGTISLPARDYGLSGLRVYTAGVSEFGVMEMNEEEGAKGDVCCNCEALVKDNYDVCCNCEGVFGDKDSPIFDCWRRVTWVMPDLCYRQRFPSQWWRLSKLRGVVKILYWKIVFTAFLICLITLSLYFTFT